MYYLSMKISKILNDSLCFLTVPLLSLLAFSCGTTKTAVATEEPVPVVEETPPAKEEELPPVVEELPPVVEETPPAKEEELPPALEEPAPLAEEPVVEPPVEDDEYSRSVGDVTVSRDTFVDDKEEVLRIIKKLDSVMKDMNYREWLQYVDDESIKYWQQPANLKKAQKRLPVKGLKLNNLQDYFKYVFVPARRGRTVTEIRYISDSYIKAIQVQEEGDDIVFYYFNKISGHWMVHLPPIDN